MDCLWHSLIYRMQCKNVAAILIVCTVELLISFYHSVSSEFAYTTE